MLGRVASKAGFRAFSRRKFTADSSVSVDASSLGSKLAIAAGILGGAAALWYQTEESSSFGYVEECLPPPSYPWAHHSILKSYDHAAIRRGFEVYNTIGTACHSMKYVSYRQLVDVAYTDKEMKAIAAEYDDYLTEPDAEGEVSERPGELNDRLWNPYANEQVARAANEGAYPPDLSQIVKAREGGEDYIFALLTGYRNPPHGVTLSENQYYNVYFPGGQLAMPPPLSEGAVEYEDYPEIEASVAQLSKDVTVYLTWASNMELDERHLMGIKSIAAMTALFPFVLYWKRWRWGYIKHRDVAFTKK
eukprot:TRINITY_DN12218_c0_g1_i1.p1 TRINITY_DN12218_c0_g1~~TRINITY_DN12218_c0_g1_i1.p1  ORF type:complete len:305 (-),score=90.97 TRINITY_DN12218_c0_g1_i1:155-1069(-)